MEAQRSYITPKVKSQSVAGAQPRDLDPQAPCYPAWGRAQSSPEEQREGQWDWAPSPPHVPRSSRSALLSPPGTSAQAHAPKRSCHLVPSPGTSDFELQLRCHLPGIFPTLRGLDEVALPWGAVVPTLPRTALFCDSSVPLQPTPRDRGPDGQQHRAGGQRVPLQGMNRAGTQL